VDEKKKMEERARNLIKKIDDGQKKNDTKNFSNLYTTRSARETADSTLSRETVDEVRKNSDRAPDKEGYLPRDQRAGFVRQVEREYDAKKYREDSEVERKRQSQVRQASKNPTADMEARARRLLYGDSKKKG